MFLNAAPGAPVPPSPPASSSSSPADVLSPELLARAGAIDDARSVTAAIAGAGQDQDQLAGASVADVGAAIAVKLETELGDFLDLAVTALSPAFPNLAPIWPKPVCQKVASAFAPVMIKHGWHFTLAGFEAEIKFALVAAPLLVPTVKALKFVPAAAAPPPGPAHEKNPQPGAGAVVEFAKPSSTAPAA